MKQFSNSFHKIKQDLEITHSQISEYTDSLRNYYKKEHLSILNKHSEEERAVDRFLLEKDESVILQYL